MEVLNFILERAIKLMLFVVGCFGVYLRAWVLVLVYRWFVLASMPDMPVITPKVATGLLLIWETLRLVQPIERALTFAKAFAKDEKPMPTPFKEHAMFDALLIVGRLANTVSLLIAAYILHLVF